MDANMTSSQGFLDTRTFRLPRSTNMKSLPPEELVKNCQAGEHSAFEELIRRYQGSIYIWAYRLTRNRDAAEDIASATYLRICKGIGSCRQTPALSAWINRIVRNVWLDSLRKTQRRSEVSLTVLENMNGEGRYYGLESHDLNPLQKRVEDSERNGILVNAIGTLPKPQKEIIRLFYSEERSYEEIGQVLGIPVGTVKSRMSRARFALQRKLAHQVTSLTE